MSRPSIPARPVEPPRETNTQAQAPAPAPPSAQNAPNQAWKIVVLAVALLVLAVVGLYFFFAGPTTEESAAPVEPAYSEEEAPEEAPAPAPAGGSAEDSRAMQLSGQGAASAEGALPPLNILSVGYSPVPALRVVALRLGGALPYFLHEGESIGDIKILAIMSDRVQISHKGKNYEIKVGSDGKVHLPPQAR